MMGDLFDEFSDDYGEGPYSGYDYSLPEGFELDVDLSGINAPNLDALGVGLDFEQINDLLAQNPELFDAFKQFDPAGASVVSEMFNLNQTSGGGNLLTSDGKLTSTGTSALTGEGLIADAAADEVSDELGGDTTRLSNLTQKPEDVATAGVTTDKTTSTTTDKKGILGTDITASDAAKYAAMLAAAKLAYDDAKAAREEARGWSAPGGNAKQAVRSPGGGVTFKKAGKAMGGGIGSLEMARGGRALPPRYLKGHSDGMADKVPAHIDGKRPAALSDGEFVIPADVVSHLGNGNSNAGAKRLYKMMDDIRAARTGNPKQGKQINPDKFMPR
jgi:hypothetical protein